VLKAGSTKKYHNNRKSSKKNLASSLVREDLPETFVIKDISFKPLWKLLTKEGWTCNKIGNLQKSKFQGLYCSPCTTKSNGILGKNMFNTDVDVVQHVFENRSTKFHYILCQLLHEEGLLEDDLLSDYESDFVPDNQKENRSKASNQMIKQDESDAWNKMTDSSLSAVTPGDVWNELHHKNGWKYIPAGKNGLSTSYYSASHLSSASEGVLGFDNFVYDAMGLKDYILSLQVSPWLEPSPENIWDTLRKNHWRKEGICYVAPHVSGDCRPRPSIDSFTSLDELSRFYLETFYLKDILSDIKYELQADENPNEENIQIHVPSFGMHDFFQPQDVWNDLQQNGWERAPRDLVDKNDGSKVCIASHVKTVGHAIDGFSKFKFTLNDICNGILPLQISPSEPLSFKNIWKVLKENGWRELEGFFVAPHVKSIENCRRNVERFENEADLTYFYKSHFLLRKIRKLQANKLKKQELPRLIEEKVPVLTFSELLKQIKPQEISNEMRCKHWSYHKAASFHKRGLENAWIYVAPTLTDIKQGQLGFDVLDCNAHEMMDFFVARQVATPDFESVWTVLQPLGWHTKNGVFMASHIDAEQISDSSNVPGVFKSEESLVDFYKRVYFLEGIVTDVVDLMKLKAHELISQHPAAGEISNGKNLPTTKRKSKEVEAQSGIKKTKRKSSIPKKSVAPEEKMLASLSLEDVHGSGRELMSKLKSIGWKHFRSDCLEYDWVYAKPEVASRSEGVLGKTMFISEEEMFAEALRLKDDPQYHAILKEVFYAEPNIQTNEVVSSYNTEFLNSLTLSDIRSYGTVVMKSLRADMGWRYFSSKSLVHDWFYAKPGITSRALGVAGKSMFATEDEAFAEVLRLRHESDYRDMLLEIFGVTMLSDSSEGVLDDTSMAEEEESVAEIVEARAKEVSLEAISLEVVQSYRVPLMSALRGIGWSHCASSSLECEWYYLKPGVKKREGILGQTMFRSEDEVIQEAARLQAETPYAELISEVVGAEKELLKRVTKKKYKIAEPPMKKQKIVPIEDDNSGSESSDDMISFSEAWRQLKDCGWRCCSGGLAAPFMYLAPELTKAEGIDGLTKFYDEDQLRRYVQQLNEKGKPKQILPEPVDSPEPSINEQDTSRTEQKAQECMDTPEPSNDDEEKVTFKEAWKEMKTMGWHYSKAGGLDSAFVYLAPGFTNKTGVIGTSKIHGEIDLLEYYMRHVYNSYDTTNQQVWGSMIKQGWSSSMQGDNYYFQSPEGKNSKCIIGVNTFATKAAAISFYLQKMENSNLSAAVVEEEVQNMSSVESSDEEDDSDWNDIWSKMKQIGWTNKWGVGKNSSSVFMAPNTSSVKDGVHGETVFDTREGMIAFYKKNKRSIARNLRNPCANQEDDRNNVSNDDDTDDVPFVAGAVIDDNLFLNDDEAAAAHREMLAPESQPSQVDNAVFDDDTESAFATVEYHEDMDSSLSFESFLEFEKRWDIVDELQKKWVGRANQIEEMTGLLGENQLSTPHMLLFGQTSTGKSTLVREILDRFELAHAVVNCEECFSLSILFRLILAQIPGGCSTMAATLMEDESEDESLEEDFDVNNYEILRQQNILQNAAVLQSLNFTGGHSDEVVSKECVPEASTVKLHRKNPKCDRLQDFAMEMEQRLKMNSSTCSFYLVLDNIEKLRELNRNIISSLLRLKRITGCNISVILISNSVSGEMAQILSAGNISCIRFPIYSSNQLQQIIQHTILQERDSSMYVVRDVVSHTISLFHRQVRDLRELLRICFDMFDWYMNKHVVHGAELMRHTLEPRVMLTLRKLYMHDFEDDATHSKKQDLDALEQKEIMQTTDAPFESKVLLMAAFLASYNTKEHNDRVFSTQQKKGKTQLKAGLKKHGGTSKRAALDKLPQVLLGPRIFSLEDILMLFIRLLEILYGDKEAETAFNESMYKQVSSLISSGMLTKVSKDGNLDQVKLKCNATLDYVVAVAETLKFDIAMYLVHE